MPRRNKIVTLVVLTISLFPYTFYSARAENVTDVDSLAEENITLTGESLQGIEPKSVYNESNGRQNPLTEVTIEREKPQDGNVLKTGNEFIDSLMEQPQPSNKPLEQGLDKNQGDRSDMTGGTLPLVNF